MRTHVNWRSHALWTVLALSLVASVVETSSAPVAVAARPIPSATSAVVNGDFSDGDSGFGTDYTSVTAQPGPTAMYSEGTYAVGTDPSAYHDLFTSMGDHTTGAGNMMIVNGATAWGQTVWSQTITSLSPNTTYVFSLWVASVTGNPASVDLLVNGTSINVTPAPSSLGVWTQIFGTWRSGSSPQANLAIKDDNADASGDDFAIDDIGFGLKLPGNTSWPHAAVVGATSNTTDQAIAVPGEDLWFAVPIQPDSELHLTLSGMTNNLDLTVFTDISQVFSGLTNLRDLTQVTAESSSTSYAPHYFSPHYFSPHYFSPHYFSPTDAPINAFSPDSLSPSAVTASTLPPSTLTSSALDQGSFDPNSATLTVFNQTMFQNIDQATLTDAFSNAQERSLLAVSANEGTADESITAQTWNNTGDYYIRVSGRNGAVSPFGLQVASSGGPCDDVTLSDFSSASTIQGDPGPSTVILTDPARMAGTSADMAALNTALTTFSNQVNGVIVNLDNSDRVNELNAQADANPSCPYAKNLVAEAIRDIVNTYRPGLQYVVIAGADDVIPFFRYHDAAGLGPESDYYPPVRDTSPSQASLRNDNYLSQDAYGAQFDMSVQGRILPLPDVAVGRLVESPAEITATLNRYTDGTTKQIDVSSTLATGYDFLADGAHAVAAEFAAGDQGGNNDTLITNQGVPPSQTTQNNSPDPNHSWTATDLSNALLGSRHDVVFLAGHFSSSGALAADYSTALFASEVANSDANLTDSLIFSAGCHSGYNLVDQDGIDGLTDDLDWAEAFAQKGATLVAGAGYQYGDSDFVAYSEKLYSLFAHDLREGSSVATGDALAQAKQDYLTSLTDVDGIDQKSLLEATLYGLPMQQVAFPNTVTPPAPSSSVNPAPVSSGPGSQLGLQTASVDIAPSLTSKTVTLASANGPVTASYLTGPGGKTVVSQAVPTLPLAQLDASVTGQVLRGMVFRKGTYTDMSGVTPLTGSATTEQSAANVPFLSSGFYPSRTAVANYFDTLTGGHRTIINATPVQYRSDSPTSLTDTQRTYSDMQYDLYYSNNISAYGPDDHVPALAAPPSVTVVNSGLADDGSLFVSAHVVGDPAAGIQEVLATYAGKPGTSLAGKWNSVDLSQDPGDSTMWNGEMPAACVAARCTFFVQAVNGVGEVGVDDNYGMYYAGNVVAGQLPGGTTPTTLTLDGGIPTSRTYGGSLPVGAVLKDGNGNPVSHAAVTFSLGGGAGVIAGTDSQGHATASLPVNVDPGSFALSASYAGSSSFSTSTSDSLEVTVAKRPTSLALSPQPDGTFAAALTDDAGNPLSAQTVTLVAVDASGSVVDTTAALTDVTGTATFPASAAPPGAQQLTAWFGDENTLTGAGATSDQRTPVYAASRSTPLRLPSLTFDSTIATQPAYNTTLTVGATLQDGGSGVSGATVVFSLGDATASGTTDSNGHATASIKLNMTPGTYPLTAKFAGNNSVVPTASAPLTVTVVKRPTALSLTRVPSDGSFAAALTDTIDPTAILSGQAVTLVATNAAGAVVGSTVGMTGADGTATFPATAAPASTASLVAWFGDLATPTTTGTADRSTTYWAASKSAGINPPTVTVTDLNNGAAFGKPVSFKIAVRGSSNGSTAPQGTVSLLVDGHSVYSTTLVNGAATISTSVLFPVSSALTRQITVAYSGDNNFLSATSGTLTHSIACTLYTGTQKSGLNFTKSGASYCVVGATVNGSINVGTGAAAAVINTTTVNSTINANGAGVVMVCNSNAGGGISVANAKGAGVIVGGPTDSLCTKNTAKGSLTLQNDLYGVQALNNSVLNTVCKKVAAVKDWPYPGDISQVTGCRLSS